MSEINEDGRVRRTDAKERMDVFDFLQKFDKQEPRVFADYPEQVLNALRLFQQVWKLPEHIIPKKDSSKYTQWVSELTEIISICESEKTMKRAIPLSLEIYNGLKNRFMVTRPLAIKSCLIDAVGRIKREEETKKENKEEQEKYIPKKQLGKQIRGFLEEE